MIKKDVVKKSLKNVIEGGFRASASVNYMKPLLDFLPPQFKGLGGLGLNMNFQMKYEELDEILDHPVIN